MVGVGIDETRNLIVLRISQDDGPEVVLQELTAEQARNLAQLLESTARDLRPDRD